MSGHSKWANIKHKKDKADAARGKIYTKIGREIAIAVKEGGSNPDSNSKLRDVIAKAKAAKDWATSDQIRDALAADGFEVKDTKDGVTWKLNK